MEGIQWMTVADVAKELDLKPKTIYLMSSEGCPIDRRLPSHRLGPKGGKLRFNPKDIQAYIESTRTKPKVTSARLQILQPRVGTKKRPG